jgi:hypothetical protein
MAGAIVSYPTAKGEITERQVVHAKVRVCTHWTVPKTVGPSRGQQILLVRWHRQNGIPQAGTYLLPMQLVERPGKKAMEGIESGYKLERGQMPPGANI